jgi:hypothetical protein
MQLDSTQIAIRERSFLETLDLALDVVRNYALPLLLAFWCAVLPLMGINYALIGHMAHVEAFSPDEEPDDFDVFMEQFFVSTNVRYYWNLILLTFLETPLLSIPIVGFLGPAVFKQQPTVRQILKDSLQFIPHLTWTLLLLRGIAPAWLLYAVLDRGVNFSFTEGFFVPLVVMGASIVRSVRPYIVEIILLERNPLFSKKTGMTVGQRSSLLHGPSAGDLFAWFLGSALIAILLSLMILTSTYTLCGALIGQWDVSPLKVYVLYPLVLWHVAGFFAVAGFLGYLNLRIRHEGWEVELLMKAEGARLASRWG